jgi:CDP-diacylglycerol--serine O-phosphatidyltransferase
VENIELKDLFTLANAACGFLVILLPVAGFQFQLVSLDVGVVLIVLAVLFDFLDGRIARSSPGGHNVFGREIDSLADAVSFGVAPLAYIAWKNPGVFSVALGLGFAALFFYLFCALVRLAQYNIQQERSIYYGLPTPPAALLAIAAQFVVPQFVWLILIALVFLMV